MGIRFWPFPEARESLFSVSFQGASLLDNNFSFYMRSINHLVILIAMERGTTLAINARTLFR